MKKIYIVRHAKAQKNGFESDFDRDLNSKGKEDIQTMFSRLQKYDLKPDFFLASPALRTAKTAKKFALLYGFDEDKISFDQRLYEISALELFEILKSLDDTINELFIVGHNPCMLELCELLSEICLQSFPTCSVLGLELNITSFKELQTHNAKLLFFENLKEKRS
ncbi:phosphoglycerate mutase [Campylobacter sp. MIT 99-7217]|uniref:SixA phosphatase family protein n=1 Tax=Campylobacter sp. MIT 99-7217 TaxID=535091 RepID=UPI001158F1A0|nr:histidine phosphatase family protein [Campylobacter sp. MIT 99-7217]TQR32998.1 phosphoglycerate mutase [Campylobacter sp. MIT 99-7217]